MNQGGTVERIQPFHPCAIGLVGARSEKAFLFESKSLKDETNQLEGESMRANAKAETESVTGTMTGAEILIESLKRENVEIIFGYPGGAVLPIYDALYKNPIRHILAKHEQGAIHAAEGYARVSGKPGVVIATSGPGATNLITGITDAMMDSLPLVIFTGQVATNVIGSDAFQEADIIGITMPITKHNYQVRNLNDLPKIVKEAFHIATTGRPGPVLIDIPKDIANNETRPSFDHTVELPGYQPTIVPNILQIRKLTEAIATSQKPVILAGAGVLHAQASDELLAFAEETNIPVVNTLLGLGSFPADHPLFLGMGGCTEPIRPIWPCMNVICSLILAQDLMTA